MRPQPVAFDLDGVLYDFMGGVVQRLRDRWNMRARPSDFPSYDIKTWPFREEIVRDLLEQVQDPEFYHALEPYPDAAEVLENFATVGTVHVVTSRPPKARFVTQAALVRDFGNVVQFPIFMGRHDKWKAAKAFGARLAVEDNVAQAQEYANHHIFTYLRVHPYTPDTRRQRLVQRVDSLTGAWEDFRERWMTSGEDD